MSIPQLEIACFTTADALVAVDNGAGRIELCGGPISSGGLTPDIEDFTSLKSKLILEGWFDLPVYVMIRPHAKSFCYSSQELDHMIQTIKEFRAAGADGFVFGALAPFDAAATEVSTKIDIDANTRLTEAAAGLPCTFHRAFDELGPEKMSLIDRENVLKLLKDIGFSAVLTCGWKGKTAWHGRVTLASMKELGPKGLDIIPGGSVRCGNLISISRSIDTPWYHSSATDYNGSIDPLEIQGLLQILRENKIAGANARTRKENIIYN